MPRLRGFKPFGCSEFKQNETEVVLFEEYEALRLSEYEGLDHDSAAAKMNVSRPTFTRILNKCISKIANAFIEGKTIVVDGGEFEFAEKVKCCNSCEKPGELGKHDCEKEKGNESKSSLEILGLISKNGKMCFCSECDYQTLHKKGVRCCDLTCPNCNVPLMRHKFK